MEDDEDQFSKDAKLNHTKVPRKVFSEEGIESVLVSNAISFFFAGFDNSAIGMSLAMYFLAKHPDVQARVYDEVSEAAEKYESEHLDYDTIQKLAYLEQVT